MTEPRKWNSHLLSLVGCCCLAGVPSENLQMQKRTQTLAKRVQAKIKIQKILLQSSRAYNCATVQPHTKVKKGRAKIKVRHYGNENFHQNIPDKDRKSLRYRMYGFKY